MTRVLVVDDDDAIRSLLGKLLSRHGLEVDNANDGVAALEKLRSETYDAVLLDLMMPRKSGFDVVAELRESDPELLSRILIISAFPDRAFEALGNVCRIVPKPFEIPNLLAAIAECVGTSGPPDAVASG